jgi:hypothetical protein
LLTSPQPVNQQTHRNDSRGAHRKFPMSPRRPVWVLPSKQFNNMMLTIQEMLIFHDLRTQPSLHPTTHSFASYRNNPDAVCPTKVRGWSLLTSCAHATRGLRKMRGNRQPYFLLAEPPR